MNTEKLHITLYTIPQAACDQKKMSWNDAASLLKNQMESAFQNMVEFKHIEFMSGQWFEHQKAQEILENGTVNFPYVLVDGEIACADKKINVSNVNRAIQQKLL